MPTSFVSKFPWVQLEVHIFGELKESCPPQFFFGSRTQDRNFFQKKGHRCLFLSNLRHTPPPKLPCMGGGPAAHGRYLLDGAWSCIPGHAASSADFIVELKSMIEGLSELLHDPPSCRDPDEVRARRHSPHSPPFQLNNLAYGTPLHVSLSFQVGQVILYSIEHHRAQLRTDLQCDVAACEAERGPAPRIQENFLGLLI